MTTPSYPGLWLAEGVWLPNIYERMLLIGSAMTLIIITDSKQGGNEFRNGGTSSVWKFPVSQVKFLSNYKPSIVEICFQCLLASS